VRPQAVVVQGALELISMVRRSTVLALQVLHPVLVVAVVEDTVLQAVQVLMELSLSGKLEFSVDVIGQARFTSS
jgi:hypothetical protein